MTSKFHFRFVSMYYILQTLYRPGQITVEQRCITQMKNLYVVQAS